MNNKNVDLLEAKALDGSVLASVELADTAIAYAIWLLDTALNDLPDDFIERRELISKYFLDAVKTLSKVDPSDKSIFTEAYNVSYYTKKILKRYSPAIIALYASILSENVVTKTLVGTNDCLGTTSNVATDTLECGEKRVVFSLNCPHFLSLLIYLTDMRGNSEDEMNDIFLCRLSSLLRSTKAFREVDVNDFIKHTSDMHKMLSTDIDCDFDISLMLVYIIIDLLQYYGYELVSNATVDNYIINDEVYNAYAIKMDYYIRLVIGYEASYPKI